jgi:hypothetical protein
MVVLFVDPIEVAGFVRYRFHANCDGKNVIAINIEVRPYSCVVLCKLSSNSRN